MTRITLMSLSRMRLHFRVPVRFGNMSLTSQEVGVLQLTTGDGLVGLGEVAGPTLAPGIESEMERARRALLGRDPAEAEAVGGVLGAALDTAILDLQGQVAGRSMADLLGSHTDSVAVNALLVMTGSPAADAAAAHALVGAGFRTIKLKPDAGTDLASLITMRDAIGWDVGLRLDLNGRLSESVAIDWLATLDGLGLEYVEQPIAPSLGVAALARVRRSVPMPLAADESLTDVDAATALLDAGACDVMVVKPARVGGPRASIRIAGDAAAAGVDVTVSTLYESGIGLAAALHVAATIPDDRPHGLGTGDLLEADIIDGRLTVASGRLALPSRSGLGVALDAAAMVRSQVPT
jgi:L-alanine-DL-glutamate epimerase-like enolase superfamily enzyme